MEQLGGPSVPEPTVVVRKFEAERPPVEGGKTQRSEVGKSRSILCLGRRLALAKIGDVRMRLDARSDSAVPRVVAVPPRIRVVTA